MEAVRASPDTGPAATKEPEMTRVCCALLLIALAGCAASANVESYRSPCSGAESSSQCQVFRYMSAP
jgi:hypothetical protein